MLIGRKIRGNVSVKIRLLATSNRFACIGQMTKTQTRWKCFMNLVYVLHDRMVIFKTGIV